jgi:TetR/AcrR family transcriptional regulator, mexJK operon transcriptional repressor
MSAQLRAAPGTAERRARHRRGRPPRAVAAALTSTIVEAAMRCFLADGYAATSLERVAAQAGVSKRTLYARFRDKPVLFAAAVAALIDRWRARYPETRHTAPDLAAGLAQAGAEMLEVSLSPEGLALFRLLVAEGARVPHLPSILAGAGAGVGIERVAALLAAHGVREPAALAEQFQRLVVTTPQLRALGLGPAMDEAARAAWLRRAVATILGAAHAGTTAPE